MTTLADSPAYAENALYRRLSRFTALEHSEESLLASLVTRRMERGLMAPMATQSPGVILSGWCARILHLGGGRRQIVSLLLPGDVYGVEPSPWAAERLPIVALTPVVVADAAPLQKIASLRATSHNRLLMELERQAASDQAFTLAQVARLGQLTAYERVGNLLLELSSRLNEVGLCYRHSFSLLISQPTMAELLGLSAVHINRIFTQLRREGHIRLRGKSMTLLKADELALACSYPFRVPSISQQ